MEYKQFLETKKQKVIESGFEVSDNELNENLFDFQRYIIKIALRKGKFAVFADCGLGKTLMQLSWVNAIYDKTSQKSLILCPLGVLEQTKLEAEKFNIDLDSFDIINYEQLKNTDVSNYIGVVLDESSILKGRDGKRSNYIINTFKKTRYKLCCTATPSPNDHMELGMHSEFLDAMSYLEMLAMYFVHDSSETQKWRLRKHAVDNFWKYVCNWSISLDNPKTLGFNNKGYDLPDIEFIEHIIKMDNNGYTLFNDNAVSATDLHKDLKRSFNQRIEKTKELVNNSNDNWIVWTLGNEEAKQLSKVLEDNKNVQGSDKPEIKAKNLNGFGH